MAAVLDVLGREITAGCTVVYAANGGRSEHLRKATVITVTPRLIVRADVPQRAGGFATRTVVLRNPLRVVVDRRG